MTPAMDLTRNFIKIVRTGRGITAGGSGLRLHEAGRLDERLVGRRAGGLKRETGRDSAVGSLLK